MQFTVVCETEHNCAKYEKSKRNICMGLDFNFLANVGTQCDMFNESQSMTKLKIIKYTTH